MNRVLKHIPLFLTILCALVYSVVLSLKSIQIHYAYGTSAYDIGLADQAIWLLRQLEIPFSTIKGVHRFGDHATFYDLIVYAPLFLLNSSVDTLLIAQSVFLGAAALPLFLLARARTQSPYTGFAIALCYLLTPAIINMNLENFHSEVIAVFFLSWLLWSISAQRYRLVVLFAFLGVIGKEDIGVSVGAFGICWWLCTKERKVGLTLTCIGFGWYLVASRIIMPYAQAASFFSPDHPLIYSYWFKDIFSDPFNWSRYQERFFNEKTLAYFHSLFSPTGYLSFLGLPYTLGALPPLGINLLSGSPYLVSVHYHYNYATVPFIFAGVIEGVRRISCWCTPHRILQNVVLLSLSSLIVCLTLHSVERDTIFPGSTHIRDVAALFESQERTIQEKIRDYAFSLIPQEASISAHHSLIPHLTHRKYAYMYPNPFEAAYWNMWFKEGRDLPSPLDIEYVLLDWSDMEPHTRIGAEILSHSTQFQSHFHDSSIQLLKRVSRSSSPHNGLRYIQYDSASALHENGTSVSHGILHSVFFPSSPQELRNYLGEKISPHNGNIYLQIEGYLSLLDDQYFSSNCSGSCNVYIDTQLHKAGDLVTKGIHTIRIEYASLPTAYGIEIIFADKNETLHSPFEDALYSSTENETTAETITRIQSTVDARHKENTPRIQLLKNNTFTLKNATLLPSSWDLATWEKSAGSVQTNSTQTTNGTFDGACITHRDIADSRFVQKVLLTPGKEYTLEGTLRVSNVQEGAGAAIGIESPSLSLRSRSLIGSTDWSSLKTSFTVSRFEELPVTATIYCRLGNYGAPSTGMLCCNSLSLYER